MALHDPIAPMLVVATNEMFRDPALADLSDAEIKKYRLTRDLDAIRDRLQGTPTVFVVQRMKPTVAMHLHGLVGPSRVTSAIAFACHEVRLPDGALMRPDTNRMEVAEGGSRFADNDWINEIADRYGAATVEEIGRIALEWARLPRSARGPFVY